ncbi:MAG: transglutaminase domain-containing protein [Planctomycetota bacterium]
MRALPVVLAVVVAVARGQDRAPEVTAATALTFLQQHMPAADRAALPPELLQSRVDAALAARAAVPWGADLPEALFLNHVLPYAQADEPREDWWTDFARRFLPRVADCATPGAAALRLNELVFDELGVHYSTGRKRALSAPSESIAQGKATCTGLSILLADACRACCVPARLVSVRWPHRDGNHTWVEVWDGAAWRFVGADEPDPNGFDRAWFTADAARCAGADRAHRIWAVSFAPTGERFAPGWGPGELWGEDVTARYAQADGDAAQDPATAAVAAQLDRWFAADEAARAAFEFDRNLDAELRTLAGDARLRALVAAAWMRSERDALAEDHAARRVRAGGKESPFTVKQVGARPAGGWPLVIAMHGGGGVPEEVNDGQWRHMQVYYKDHPEAAGYLYCALRAPTDEWNGFYTDYVYPLLERLIRQFVVCDGVDPERVIAIGYSHGGYGAFAIGPKLPHRFAAVHASAAAPTDGETVATGLHTLAFSFMVGGEDRAYGRRERCERFEGELAALRRRWPGRYATTFTLVEGNGHTGLPDRDLLAQLVPKVRTPTPRWLRWEPTDGVVRDHYWLRVDAPQRGQRLEAECRDQRLTVTTHGEPACAAWLDARLCDLAQDLEVTVDGETRRMAPAPSLRALCATTVDRGDPGLAATWIVPLR